MIAVDNQVFVNNKLITYKINGNIYKKNIIVSIHNSLLKNGVFTVNFGNQQQYSHHGVNI